MQQTIKGVIVLVITIAILAASFWLGKFSHWFESNQCYSNIVNEIKVGFSPSNTSEQDKALQDLLNKIELRGYETECHEIIKNIGL